MQTIAILSNKIPGLVDFANRLGKPLQHHEIRLVHIATCAFDIFSEATPENECIYLADFLKSDSSSLTVLEQAYFDSHVTTSVLWPDIDRFIALEMNLPELYTRPDLLTKLFGFFLHAFKTQNVEMILYEPLSNCFALSAYHAAQFLGLPFISLMPGRMPGRYEIMTDPMTPERYLSEVYCSTLPADTIALAQDYIATIESKTLEYMATTGYNPGSLAKKYLQWNKINGFIGELASYYKHRSSVGSFFHWQNPFYYRWRYFIRSLKRNLRLKALGDYFTFVLPDDPFVLYPTHFHPEASTSVFGAAWQNELHTITQIASNLPAGLRLVVKDHIHAVGYESLSYYRALKKLPNVTMLAPSFNIKTAIRRCSALITNTSTAGFEALALGKTVYLLGSAAYDYVPWCIKLHQLDELPMALKKGPVNSTEQEQVQFVAAYVAWTHAGSFNFDAQLATPDIEQDVATWVFGVLSKPKHQRLDSPQ
jgi:Capsule polysaccharide biosynthesis protein